MSEAIRGFWAAVATPLMADGNVDNAKLAGHALGLFKRGLDGVVLFGTTGEGTSFNVAERIATVEALLKAGVPATRIGLGGGFPAFTDSIALTRPRAEPRRQSCAITCRPISTAASRRMESSKSFCRNLRCGRGRPAGATLYHIPQVSGVASAGRRWPRTYASVMARWSQA